MNTSLKGKRTKGLVVKIPPAAPLISMHPDNILSFLHLLVLKVDLHLNILRVHSTYICTTVGTKLYRSSIDIQTFKRIIATC